MNEAETRAEHIDPALKAAGWGVVEGSRVLREHGITLGRLQGSGGKGARAKAEVADYVLVYRDTKLAVIEAKAWDKPPTEGIGQPRATPRGRQCGARSPPMARRSMASTWPPAPKATWPATRAPMSCGSCPGAHSARRHPQEGQGAEERQHFLHHFLDLHERSAG